MDELLKKAAKFLEENYNLNEIELTDSYGNKVRIVRNTPTPQIWGNNPPTYPRLYPDQY